MGGQIGIAPMTFGLKLDQMPTTTLVTTHSKTIARNTKSESEPETLKVPELKLRLKLERISKHGENNSHRE